MRSAYIFTLLLLFTQTSLSSDLAVVETPANKLKLECKEKLLNHQGHLLCKTPQNILIGPDFALMVSDLTVTAYFPENQTLLLQSGDQDVVRLTSLYSIKGKKIISDMTQVNIAHNLLIASFIHGRSFLITKQGELVNKKGYASLRATESGFIGHEGIPNNKHPVELETTWFSKTGKLEKQIVRPLSNG